QDVGGGRPDEAAAGLERGEEARVGDGRGLRLAGGARGELEVGEVAWAGRGRRERGGGRDEGETGGPQRAEAGGEPRGARVVGHDEVGRDPRQAAGDGLGRQGRVDGDGDGADELGAEEGAQEGGAGRQGEGHAV